MKFHYEGKYSGDEATLPRKRHQPYAQMFKEFEDSKKLGLYANIFAVIILVILMIPVVLKWKIGIIGGSNLIWWILPLLTLFPHELLHAICFKEDVYMYTNLRQGMLFVLGTETMSKTRFILMSLFPNIVFGFVPYILGFIIDYPGPSLFGAICTAMGAGDYYNVFNAATQMPKGSRTYMYGFHSFWYMPPSDEPTHLSEMVDDMVKPAEYVPMPADSPSEEPSDDAETKPEQPAEKGQE